MDIVKQFCKSFTLLTVTVILFKPQEFPYASSSLESKHLVDSLEQYYFPGLPMCLVNFICMAPSLVRVLAMMLVSFKIDFIDFLRKAMNMHFIKHVQLITIIAVILVKAKGYRIFQCFQCLILTAICIQLGLISF